MKKLTGEYIVAAMETTETKVAFYNKLKAEISPVDEAGKPKRVARKNLPPLLVKYLLADVFRGEEKGAAATDAKKAALFGLLTVALQQGVIKPEEAFDLVVPYERIRGMPTEQGLRQEIIGVLLDGCPAALKEQETIIQGVWVDFTSRDDDFWKIVEDKPIENMAKAVKQGVVDEAELAEMIPHNNYERNMRVTSVLLDCQTDTANRIIEDNELVRGVCLCTVYEEEAKTRAVARKTLAKALACGKASVKDVFFEHVGSWDPLVVQEISGMLLEHKPHEFKAEKPDFFFETWETYHKTTDADVVAKCFENLKKAIMVEGLVSVDDVVHCLGLSTSLQKKQKLTHLALEHLPPEAIARSEGEGNIRDELMLAVLYGPTLEEEYSGAFEAVAFRDMKKALRIGAMDTAYAVREVTDSTAIMTISEKQRLSVLEAIYEAVPSVGENDDFQRNLVRGVNYCRGAEWERYGVLFAKTYDSTSKPKRTRRAKKASVNAQKLTQGGGS